MDVVWHEHVFAPSHDHDGDDDVTGRFDAVEYADGRFAVWSPSSRSDVETCASRDDALRRARELAGHGAG